MDEGCEHQLPARLEGGCRRGQQLAQVGAAGAAQVIGLVELLNGPALCLVVIDREAFGVFVDGLALLGVGGVAGAAPTALGLPLPLNLFGSEAGGLVQGDVLGVLGVEGDADERRSPTAQVGLIFRVGVPQAPSSPPSDLSVFEVELPDRGIGVHPGETCCLVLPERRSNAAVPPELPPGSTSKRAVESSR